MSRGSRCSFGVTVLTPAYGSIDRYFIGINKKSLQIYFVIVICVVVPVT